MFTLSSNNESLIETEKKKTPKFPVCLQCNSLCPLLIDYTIPTKITFKCPCGNEEKTLLSEYIDKIQNNFKPIKNLCIKHKYKSYQSFCITCKQHLCADCNNNNQHKEHSIVELSERAEQVKEIGKQNLNYFFVKDMHIRILVTSLVLGLEEKIKKIQEAYREYENNNLLVLTYMLYLYQNQDKYPNYYWQENVLNSPQMKDKEYRAYHHDFTNPFSEKSIKDLIDFLKTYNIMNNKVNIEKIKPIRTIKTHHINNIILLKDGRLASSSSDKTIRIYDKNTYKETITLKGHTSYVEYISQDQETENLLSCSNDRSIRIWEKTEKTFECIKILENAHNDSITKVIPIDWQRMASCSRDMTIKIWEKNSPYGLITTLDHGNYVSSIMKINNLDQLISASSLTPIVIWNLITYKPIVNFKMTCTNANSMIESKGKIIIAGIAVMVIELNYKKINVLDNIGLYNNNLHSVLELRDGSLLVGGEKGLMYLYDTYKKLPEVKKTNETRCINSLIPINDNSFISTSANYITIWKY